MAIGLFVLGFTLAALSAADDPPPVPDPPPKLKKKDRPAPGSEKPANPEEDRPLKRPGSKLGEVPDDEQKKPDAAEQPPVDREELLRQVLKSSRKAEDRIANKELDEPTKQHQRDVIAGIDEL